MQNAPYIELPEWKSLPWDFRRFVWRMQTPKNLEGAFYGKPQLNGIKIGDPSVNKLIQTEK